MSHRVAFGRFVPRDLVRDGGQIRLQFGNTRTDRLAVLGEHLAPRAVGRVALRAQFGKRADFADRHARRLQPHDELQPVQIRSRIESMAAAIASHHAQQACLLVVAQRMGGNAGGSRHLTDRERFRHDGSQVRTSSALQVKRCVA